MKSKNTLPVFLCLSFALHGAALSDAALSRWFAAPRESKETKKTAGKRKAEYLQVFFEKPVAEKFVVLNVAANNKKTPVQPAARKKFHAQTKMPSRGTQFAYDVKTTAADASLQMASDAPVNPETPAEEAYSLPVSGNENAGVPSGKKSGDVLPSATPSMKESDAVAYKSPEPAQKGPDEKALIASYLANVRGRILSAKNYPARLREEEMEGEVNLKVTLNSKGNVMGVSVQKSSGYGALDAHAKNIIYSLSPFPPFPDGIQRASLSVRVPLRFVIK